MYVRVYRMGERDGICKSPFSSKAMKAARHGKMSLEERAAHQHLDTRHLGGWKNCSRRRAILLVRKVIYTPISLGQINCMGDRQRDSVTETGRCE